MIYEDEPFLDRIDRVADAGFESVEFWTWPEKDIDAIERRLDERGLSLAAMAANTEQARPEDHQRAMTDPSQRSAVVSDIERSIKTAKRLDCPNLIVLVGPELDHPRQKMYDSVVECLWTVAPIAEEAGVSLLIEPLNTLVDHEGYFLERSRAGYEMVREVDSPAVGLLFDIYHQQIAEGNITANLIEFLDEIGHLHVADVPGRHEPGTGELNYRNILSAVNDAGYDGYVGFEFRPAKEPETALSAVQNLVTAVRETPS